MTGSPASQEDVFDRRGWARRRAGLSVAARSPLTVAAVVLALYGAWAIGACTKGGLDARDFAFVGSASLERSDTSPAIEANAAYAIRGPGYDGQYFLFIAQDPARAHDYTEWPAYRYGRISYPLLARVTHEVLGIGIPVALLASNILIVCVGVFALGRWLQARKFSPWIALIFGLHPGVFVSVVRDLSDAMAYGLVAVAVLASDRRRSWGLGVSALLFSLAIFTRETTAVFAAVWALALLFDGSPRANWRRTALFATVAFAPYLLYRAFLVWWLDDAGLPETNRPSPVPFGGILEWWPWSLEVALQFCTVVLPGLFCLVLALWGLARRIFEPAVLVLAVTALLYAVLLPTMAFSDWYASLRITLGVVVAFVLAVPVLQSLFGPLRTWFLWPAIAWFYPWVHFGPLAVREWW